MYTPVFIANNSNSIAGYDLYLNLLDKYKMLPEGSLYYEVTYEDVLSMIRQIRQGELNFEVQYALLTRLCHIIKTMAITDWNRLKKAIGIAMDYGISIAELSAIIKHFSLDCLEVPVTKEELFAVFKDMKMNSYTAFQFIF